MRALLAAASLALGAAQFVPTPCSSTFDCASGSACTAWRNGSQCVSLTTGATPCLAYTSEPGAAAFLPYGAFGAANRRTGVLFRVNTCGGGGGSAAQSSIALFPPGASTFELREDFGADFAALSADSTSWWQDSIGSAPVAVNELYRARFLLLLDVSASALAQYSSSSALNDLSTGISAVLTSGFNTLYAASRTQPVEFAVYAFAGDRQLVQLTQWSAFDQGADSVLFQGGGSINPAYLLSRAYPFVSDSTALYWAVPAALAALQARSAAGTADDLYPATMDTLVVVSDFLDTAGQRPEGAQSGQGAREAFQAATFAAATQGVAFIAVPLSFSADADVQNAVNARTYLAQLPGSALATISTWGAAVNSRFARGVGAYVSPPGTAWDANTLSMLTFCPAYTAGEPDARGMEVRAGALASALPPQPTPIGLATALRYPSPPPGRCNPTQLAQATPAPSADPCAPAPTPTPAPPLVSACTFFAGGGSGTGRTTARTARGLRLECPSAYPAVPTPLPTPTPAFCTGGGGGGGGAAAAPVAVEVTSSVTPPGTSAGFALLILAVLALVGVVGVAARNVGALAIGGGGGGAAAAPPRQQHLPTFSSAAEGAGKGPAGSGGVVGNPLNLPGAAVGVQNW